MESIKTVVTSVLPGLTPDVVSTVLTCLQDCGVECVDDLTLVEERDLAGCLKPIQIRKLLRSAKPEASPSPSTPSSSSSLSLQSSPAATAESTASTPTRSLSPVVDSSWASTFVIPEASLSTELRTDLARNDRLSPRLRRELVRKLVDAATVHCKRPKKRDLDLIALQVVSRYPTALKDVIDGAVVGSGHISLTAQLVARVENVNRSPSSCQGIRRKRLYPELKERRELRPIDGLGCVNWQPALPENETEESQHSLKTTLQEMHQRGQWDNDRVRELCSLSYYLQRQEINRCISVATLLSEWPFLVVSEVFYGHVNELLGFDVRTCIHEALQQKGPRLIAFLRTVKSMQSSTSVLHQLDTMSDAARRRNGHLAVVLPALMHYFKEDLHILCRGIESTANREDIEQLELPSTPCILFRGTSVLEAAEFAVSAEGSLLFDGLSFSDALSAWFSTFFMLNMEYPSDAASTMEFIQRCLAHINPDRGTKTQPKHGKKTHSIPAKVLRLVNQLGSFEWHTVD